MKEKCEVKYCQEKKCWRLYKDDESVDGACYPSKEAAISAARCYCEETGDELCIYNKNGELTSRRIVNNHIGE
jgi:hypothetical protein